MLYRLRNALQYRRFAHSTRALASRPLSCDPAALCQVHTMLTRRDVPMYLVAIKSLLRHYAKVAVVIHSDGTLTEGDAALLKRHVPGAVVIMAAEADARAAREIGDGSYLARWRSIDASWRRLVDTELWCTAPKRLIMDADVLVLQPPTHVVEWIENGAQPLLLGQPPVKVDAAAPIRDPHIQQIFISRLAEIGDQLQLGSAFLDGTTGGFYGCMGQLRLAPIEQLLRVTTGLGIPMQQWGGEQCTVIYLLSAAGGRRLPPAAYFNYAPKYESSLREAHVVHFYGTHRFHNGHYRSLGAAVMGSAPRLG